MLRLQVPTLKASSLAAKKAKIMLQIIYILLKIASAFQRLLTLMLLSRSLICPSNPQMHMKEKVLVIYSLGTIPGHWKSTHNCQGKMLHWLEQSMVQLIPSRALGITVQHRSEWWPACPTHTFLQHFYLLNLCTLTSATAFLITPGPCDIQILISSSR